MSRVETWKYRCSAVVDPANSKLSGFRSAEHAPTQARMARPKTNPPHKVSTPHVLASMDLKIGDSLEKVNISERADSPTALPLRQSCDQSVYHRAYAYGESACIADVAAAKFRK